MKLSGSVGLALGVVLPVSSAGAVTAPRVGDTYQITRNSETIKHGALGSSSSSQDKDTIIERVIGLGADGTELEYDLPKSNQPDQSTGNWQFPVRVFKPLAGEVQLLNRSELEGRIDTWLKAAKLPRTACGHWIFTWNAFQIECDPQSVIKTIEAFTPVSADLHDGAAYQDADAQGSGILVEKASVPDGATFIVTLSVDPNNVRRSEAESDVVVGEIMRKPMSLDAAILRRSKETISGTISVTLETDATGSVRRQTKITKLEIENTDGQPETETVTETLERKLIARGQ